MCRGGGGAALPSTSSAISYSAVTRRDDEFEDVDEPPCEVTCTEEKHPPPPTDTDTESLLWLRRVLIDLQADQTWANDRRRPRDGFFSFSTVCAASSGSKHVCSLETEPGLKAGQLEDGQQDDHQQDDEKSS